MRSVHFKITKMKKIIIATIVSVGSLTVFAQEKAGKRYHTA
jgi:hypothetical protein